MELEVIIQGKGSVTVKQEVDWTRKDIEKLAERSFDLINRAAPKRDAFGFEGGSQVQAEHATNWVVPAVADVDARAK